MSLQQVCLHIEVGCLGVRLIKEVNEAFLSKWLWRIESEGGALWKALLIEKYIIGNRGWDLNPTPRRASGCGGPLALV